MDYAQLAGKTIKGVKSWTEEEGVSYFELTFTDGTSFGCVIKPGIQSWARAYALDGEVKQTWE